MSQPGKEKIMKTRTTSLILSTFILAFLTLGAMQAQAFIVNWRPVGITFGQTARVNLSNTSDRAIIIIGGRFFDSDGNTLAEFGRQVIEPGKIMSFDLNADDIVRESNRIQIRGVIESPEPHLKGAMISVEVFNNADGKTTVFIWNPGD
jgi:hypothetical protein